MAYTTQLAPEARQKVARGERVSRRPWIVAQKRLSPGRAAEMSSRGLNSNNRQLPYAVSVNTFQARVIYYSVAPPGLEGWLREDPGAARNALAPGYLLPRLRRWLSGTGHGAIELLRRHREHGEGRKEN